MAAVDMELAPWERADEETPSAFQAFETYRDMGYERSLAKVARQLGKTKQIMDRWSSRHHWVDRAASWDREQDRLRRARRQVKLAEAEDRIDSLATVMLGRFTTWLGEMTPDRIAKMTPTQATAFFERAVKAQLLVLGGATENLHHGGAVDVSGSIDLARRVIDDPDAAEAALSALDRISAAS